MGNGRAVGGARAPGVLQPMRSGKSARGLSAGARGARTARAPSARPRRAAGPARNADATGATLPLPALRRTDDGVAAWAHCPPPLLGVGDRPRPLPAQEA